MLDNDEASALFAIRADRMFAHYIVGDQRVELANVELFRAVIVPEVEQPAQKIAVLTRCDRKLRRSTRRRICFNTRDKLQISQVILDAELEQSIRLLGVVIVEQNKGTELNIMLPADFDASDDPAEGSFAGMIDSIPVMKFFWPVDANAEKKLIIAKEPAPFIVQQNSISLKSIANLLAGAAVLFL